MVDSDKILEFCKTERKRNKIQEFIKIKDRVYFRTKILVPLLKKELLELTIPDKPTSSKQKYKTTKKGIKKLR